MAEGSGSPESDSGATSDQIVSLGRLQLPSCMRMPRQSEALPDAACGLQEPEKYLPERFMEGTPEAAAKPAHGYLPFGDCTRACIGLRFARMEVRFRVA